MSRLSLLLFLFLAYQLGCATTTPAAQSRGWRPVPPDGLADACAGVAARSCYQDALMALASEPPDAFRAQNLLAAACAEKVPEACQALDARFRPPRAIRVPSLSEAPPTGTAVVEFICWVDAGGELNSCRHSRSAGSNRALDTRLTEQLVAGQAGALFSPSTLDKHAYGTEVRLVYVLARDAPASQMLPQRTTFRLYAVDPVYTFWRLYPQQPF
jgi:hypothetical protein